MVKGPGVYNWNNLFLSLIQYYISFIQLTLTDSLWSPPRYALDRPACSGWVLDVSVHATRLPALNFSSLFYDKLVLHIWVESCRSLQFSRMPFFELCLCFANKIGWYVLFSPSSREVSSGVSQSPPGLKFRHWIGVFFSDLSSSAWTPALPYEAAWRNST